MSGAMKLQGGRQLRHLMEELPKRVRTKALRQGVTAAAAPVVKAAKASTPRRSGLLKKALTRKVKTYKGGNVATAIIGANREVSGEWEGKKVVPANYLHLVEDGHGDVAGKHMLANAYEANKGQASDLMVGKMQSVLESEAAKLAGT